MDDDVIKEGFLCPICLKDLKSPTNLSAHFEEFHADDKAILHQLRSVFGKAKNKILKREDLIDETAQQPSASSQIFVSKGTPESGGVDIALWDTQSLGLTKSHTSTFRRTRKDIVDRCVIETNKIIIRLEKLIKSGIYASDSSLPGVLKAKKNLERNVVPWQNDKDAKFCLNCSKKFKLTFRRHHCRLCGKIVCELCIDNLSMNLASTVLKLDSSSSLLQSSDVNLDHPDSGLKICDPCQILLIRQSRVIQDKSANAYMIQLYEKMNMSMQEADLIQPSFLKMADSVNAGETEYGIDVAIETRLKLLKAYESVEALSKKIQLLGLEKEKQPHPHVLKLQRSIRTYASNYLSNNMFTLPALPNKDQYKLLLKKKEENRDRMKIERLEKHSSQTLQNHRQQDINKNETQISNTNLDQVDGSFSQHLPGYSKFKQWKKESRPVFQAVSISKAKDAGWGPVQVTTDDSDDPIVQQMNNIKAYIEQAKHDGKYDELGIFQKNLKELEFIYMESRRNATSS